MGWAGKPLEAANWEAEEHPGGHGEGVPGSTVCKATAAGVWGHGAGQMEARPPGKVRECAGSLERSLMGFVCTGAVTGALLFPSWFLVSVHIQQGLALIL